MCVVSISSLVYFPINAKIISYCTICSIDVYSRTNLCVYGV